MGLRRRRPRRLTAYTSGVTTDVWSLLITVLGTLLAILFSLWLYWLQRRQSKREYVHGTLESIKPDLEAALQDLDGQYFAQNGKPLYPDFVSVRDTKRRLTTISWSLRVAVVHGRTVGGWEYAAEVRNLIVDINRLLSCIRYETRMASSNPRLPNGPTYLWVSREDGIKLGETISDRLDKLTKVAAKKAGVDYSKAMEKLESIGLPEWEAPPSVRHYKEQPPQKEEKATSPSLLSLLREWLR